MKVVLNNTILLFCTSTAIDLMQTKVITLTDMLVGSGNNLSFAAANTLKSSAGTNTLIFDIHNYAGKRMVVSSSKTPGNASYFIVFADSELKSNEGEVLSGATGGIIPPKSTSMTEEVVIPSGAYYAYVCSKSDMSGTIYLK